MTASLRQRMLLLISGAVVLLLLASLTGLALAAPTDLPDRPLPKSWYLGGVIVLRTVFDDHWSATGLEWQDLWTVVQWQDHVGAWHDVTGWQGNLDRVYASGDLIKGMKSWWVPETLFGAGDFRWQVYASQDGELIVQSEAFALPERGGQAVSVEVELAP